MGSTSGTARRDEAAARARHPLSQRLRARHRQYAGGGGRGCSIVTSTVGGLGERAGNAVFEEVVCALGDLYRTELRIDKMMLARLSDAVAQARACSSCRPSRWSLNVFRHESGVHVDGMLKDRRPTSRSTQLARTDPRAGARQALGARVAKPADRQGHRIDSRLIRRILERSRRPSRDHKGPCARWRCGDRAMVTVLDVLRRGLLGDRL